MENRGCEAGKKGEDTYLLQQLDKHHKKHDGCTDFEHSVYTVRKGGYDDLARIAREKGLSIKDVRDLIEKG